MEKVRLVSLLLALLVALAGCADDDGGAGDGGDGTDGGTDEDPGGEGPDGAGPDGNGTVNQTEPVPEPKLIKGPETLPDPRADVQDCKDVMAQISGQDHPAIKNHVGWQYRLNVDGFKVQFELEDGEIVDGDSMEGVVPEETKTVHLCTSDPDAAGTSYRICLTHEDWEGDRQTACDDL